MSYIDDEELKINLEEDEDVEENFENLVDDDLEEGEDPLGDEFFKGLDEIIS